MKNKFTIREQKSNETKVEYMNYIMDEIRKNMPFQEKEGADEQERYKDYYHDVYDIAAFLNCQMYPEEGLVKDPEKREKVHILREISSELRNRKKGESNVDYMDYIMNLAKKKMPFVSDKVGDERQKEYALYMEEIYNMSRSLYDHTDLKSAKKVGKKTVQKGKKKSVKKESKKEASRKKKSGKQKGILAGIWNIVKKIPKFFISIDESSLEEAEVMPIPKKTESKKRSSNKKKTVSKKNNIAKKSNPSNVEKVNDEELDELLEIEQCLNETTDNIIQSSTNSFDTIEIPDLDLDFIQSEEPQAEVESDKHPVRRVSKESSIYDEKRDTNEVVEKYVQDRMIPGVIDTENMTTAEVLDFMYPEFKPMDYQEMNDYVDFWKWMSCVEEEHAKVLTK